MTACQRLLPPAWKRRQPSPLEEGAPHTHTHTLTTELLLEELQELHPAQGVIDQLTETKTPALHPELGGCRHPAGRQAREGWCAEAPPAGEGR